MIRVTLAAFLAAFSVAAHFKALGDRALVWGPPWTYEQSSDDDGLPEGTSFERKHEGGDYILAYDFRNFNNDLLHVRAKIPGSVLDSAIDGFGYTDAGLKAVHAKYGRSGEKVYDRKVKEYLASRGFRMLQDDVVQADIPALVRRNAPMLNPVARSLDLAGSARRYSPEELVGAATAMVQTALRYKVPPASDHGRHTGGILPPVQAVTEGWGDCDTKTALLASILHNWDGMDAVGLALPHHYLMGLSRIPRKGDAFIDHEGQQYVLIEPAGPAWLAPGQVAQETLDLMDSLNGIPIQPLN
jgi:hypothetical protein